MKCPSCGSDIQEGIKKCPNCGSTTENTSYVVEQKTNSLKDSNWLRVLAPLLIVGAVVCLIIAFTRINNEDYAFYKQHYAECVEGRDDNAGTTGMFSGTYSMISDKYQEMADYDMKKINSYRIQAGVLVFCAVCLVAGAIGVYRKGKRQ